jgi:hypothetical protein
MIVNGYEISDFFVREATKLIFSNKTHIDELIANGQKLACVKLIKDLTSGGLRDSKEVFDLYIAGKLHPDVKEERKAKLERLAKTPLVDSLIVKLRNIEEDKLHLLLMNLTVDELLSIDEFFPE